MHVAEESAVQPDVTCDSDDKKIILFTLSLDSSYFFQCIKVCIQESNESFIFPYIKAVL